MATMPIAQQKGQYLARKMASHKPLTKRQMLRKWPSLGSLDLVDAAINWIEANTTMSDNPFLFVWDRGEAMWAFRESFGEVRLNLAWNLRYLLTRFATLQRVTDHSINSPVISMSPKERRAAKAVSAQAGGTVAFIESMAETLAKV